MNKNRILAIVLIILFLVPSIFTIYAVQYRKEITVGIVLTTDDVQTDAETAVAGLNDFHGIFDARILDVRFNDSDVRVQNGTYLTDDFFDPEFLDDVRSQHDVDMIMILTDRVINNWLGNRRAWWGEAHTREGAVLVATNLSRSNESTHDKYVKSVARHEVLHLLGYAHPKPGTKCVMEYSSIETELCPECKLELYYRAALWKVGFGKDSGQALFLIQVLISLILLPLFLAGIIITQYLFKKHIYKTEGINQNPLMFGIGALFMIAMLTGIVKSLYARLLLLSASIFIYVITESLFFESSQKKTT